MALIEKITRKIEIDEGKGSDIEVRETTHLIDDQTNQVIYPNASHHRYVIDAGDDAAAQAKGLDNIASMVWTPQVRADAAKRRQK